MLYTGVRPPEGPHKASFTALQLGNYLLEGWKRGEGPAPYAAYVAHYAELCAQWAPTPNWLAVGDTGIRLRTIS